MKNGKNNSGFIIGLLVGLIIMLVAVIFLFVTNTIGINNSKTVNGDDSVKERMQEENKTETSDNLDNVRYSLIIDEYRSAMNDGNYEDDSNKYSNINTNMLHLYHSNGKNVIFNYAFYDINGDGKNEMIVGDGSEGIYEIYTYDGSKVERFFNSVCLGERCAAQIYDNGIVYFNGSGGASVHSYSFYKIGSDGYSKEIIKSYIAEYDESGNVTITDDVTKAVTSFKKSDELIASVVGNGKVVDLSKINWIEIK